MVASAEITAAHLVDALEVQVVNAQLAKLLAEEIADIQLAALA